MGYHTPCLPGLHLVQAKKRVEKTVASGGMEGVMELIKGKIDMHVLDGRNNAGANSRKRLFDRMNVFVLFLIQIIGGISCGHAVKFLQGVRAVKGKGRTSSSSSAYCQGRARLELPLLKKVSGRLSGLLVSSSETWKGFRVMVVDGTGLDMPDTAANRKAYPPRSEKVEGTCLPVLNLVAIFELFSGGAADLEYGNKHCGEQTLWRSIMERIEIVGMLLMGDAYYCSFGNIVFLKGKGGDCIFPLEKKVNLERLRKLGKGEWLVRLHKPVARAKTWTEKQWMSFPDSIDLRLIERTIRTPGFRAKKIRLLATLLDSKEYPADEVAGLQKRRWDAELRLRDIKTAMGMNHLSCKTPGMISKEIMMFMIAYNLVRAMMVDASGCSGVKTARLSFASASAQTLEWMRLSILQKGRIRGTNMRKAFLDMLAECVVPDRPGRHEPRMVKRTDQRFPKMKMPRRMYHKRRRAA